MESNETQQKQQHVGRYLYDHPADDKEFGGLGCFCVSAPQCRFNSNDASPSVSTAFILALHKTRPHTLTNPSTHPITSEPLQ